MSGQGLIEWCVNINVDVLSKWLYEKKKKKQQKKKKKLNTIIKQSWIKYPSDDHSDYCTYRSVFNIVNISKNFLSIWIYRWRVVTVIKLFLNQFPNESNKEFYS